MLRFVEEMSTPEIAGVMGRSEGAVRVLIHRALRAVATERSVTDEVVRLDAYVEGVLAGRPAGPRPLMDPADIDPADRAGAADHPGPLAWCASIPRSASRMRSRRGCARSARRCTTNDRNRASGAPC